MQRFDNVRQAIELIDHFNSQIRASALVADDQSVISLLARGASLVAAIQAYREGGFLAQMQRLIDVEKSICLLQFDGYKRSVLNEMMDLLRTGNTVIPAVDDTLLQHCSIFCDAADSVRDDAEDRHDYDVMEITPSTLFAAAVRFFWKPPPPPLSTSDIVYAMFNHRCFHNPQIALRCLSQMDDASLRAAIYDEAVQVCTRDNLIYFMRSVNRDEFLQCAQKMNHYMRTCKLDYDQGFSLQHNPAAEEWLRQARARGSHAHKLPSDVAGLVIWKVLETEAPDPRAFLSAPFPN